MLGASSEAQKSLSILQKASRSWNASNILDSRDPDLVAAEKELDEWLKEPLQVRS